MAIIFESQLYPQGLEKKYAANSKVTLDFAAHNFSKAIYEGLVQNEEKVLLLNTPNIGSFPRLYKKTWVEGCRWEDGVSVGYCNVAFIKRYSIESGVKRELHRLIQILDPNEQLVLLIYNFRCVPFIDDIKKQYPGLKVCMIVTDLPEYMVNPYAKLLKYIPKGLFESKKSNDIDLCSIDGFVLLAPRMADKLPINDKPWIQMEGVYESNIKVEDTKEGNTKSILYTGNLSRRYGIIELLDAFASIESPDYELWIRGSGDCEGEIKERMRKDKRITLFPPLTREELIRLQKKATVLVNPVSPKQEFTNYFFPSKTLEYLASGTPVVMYRLSCLPKEYDDYIYYIDDSVKGLRDKLIEVCSMPADERKRIGEKAAWFVMENKTPKPQMAKVMDFIKTL